METAIVLTVVGLLSVIAVDNVIGVFTYDRAKLMAGTVYDVRETINYHAAMGDGDLAPSGYPASIPPRWFDGNLLPAHLWTSQPIIVEVVTAPRDQDYPATKVFDPSVPGLANAWYNTSNGAFCILIGSESADPISAFNKANSASILRLDQVKD